MSKWFDNLKTNDAFAREIAVPDVVAKSVATKQSKLASSGDTLKKFVEDCLERQRQ